MEKQSIQVMIEGVPVRANVLSHAAAAIENLCRKLAEATGRDIEEILDEVYVPSQREMSAGSSHPRRDITHLRGLAEQARKIANGKR